MTFSHQAQSYHRCMAFAVAVVAGLALFSSPSTSHADSDATVRIQFLGWSGINADAFLVYVADPARSSTLQVRQIGSPKPTVSIPVTADTYNATLQSPQIAQWSFVVAGYPGLSAPNKWKVFGQQEGASVRIGVTNGSQSSQIGIVQAKGDGRGKPSKSIVKTAYWSADSLRVVIVVNHRTGGAWKLDMDEAHGFKIGK